MATTLQSLLAACAFALAGAALSVPAAAATHHPHKAVKHKAKKAPAKAAQEPEPDITNSVSTEYNCELGDKVTIYTNDKDDAHIALRWQKHLHQLTRVDTTTGAQRFEDPGFGLVWIGIPAKGILLDSKHGRQLANECKSAAQANAALTTATVADKKG
jgi:membrane-bound inhibitor of C-type lysozyme